MSEAAKQAEAIADDAIELDQAGDTSEADRMLAHAQVRALLAIAYSLDAIADALHATQ